MLDVKQSYKCGRPITARHIAPMKCSHYFAVVVLLLTGCAHSQRQDNPPNDEVKTLGASANLGKGDYSSYANLADFKAKRHLYAVGPVQHMGGEVLVIDSVPYAAEIRDGNVRVTSSWNYQPPFMVYAQVAHWLEIAVPVEVKTYADVETFLSTLAKQYALPENQAFAFTLKATAARVAFSVMNRPAMPEADKKPLRAYRTDWGLTDAPVEFVGFYSTAHEGVFLGNSERVHTHVITQDRTKAGHVESFELTPGGKLFLPR